MPYKELDTKDLETWFGVSKEEMPRDLILLGTWPYRANKIKRYAKMYLYHPRARGNFDNFWIGEVDQKEVGFCATFGCGMTFGTLWELIHIGAKNIYQVGAAGSLCSDIGLYDILLPEKCTRFGGLAPFTGDKWNYSLSSPALLKRAASILDATGHNYHVGKTISVDTVYQETKRRVDGWQRSGFIGIDMETAATYAASNLLGANAIALLNVIDNLTKDELMLSMYHKSRESLQTKSVIKDVVTDLIRGNKREL